MKSLKWSLRIGALLGLSVFLAVVAVSADPAVSTGPQTAPASAPASVGGLGVSAQSTRPAATEPADRAGELLDAVVERAVAGRFDKALELIGQAPKSVADDPRVSSARKLLEEYLSDWLDFEAQRGRDYRQAVRRVGWYMIAQAHVAKHAGKPETQPETRPATQPTTQPATGPAMTLRGRVEEVLSATNKAGNSKSLEKADEQKAGELRAEAVKTLREASDRLDDALKLLGTDDGPYPGTIRMIGKSLRERLLAYQEAWEAVRTATVEQRKAGASKLLELEGRLEESLMDLQAMVDESPWRLALSQARLARLLAADKEKLAGEEWFREFLADIEARGRDAVVRAGKDENGGKDVWYDALSAYAALESLSPQNEEHRRMLKIVRRHVRVLGLYSRGPTTQPAAPDDEPQWKELIEDVDADMVSRVIPWLGRAYVSAVDFRKLVRGGLQSVRILAETPQAAETLKGLADKGKRDAFLKAIDKELDTVAARDRVNAETLQLALNEVLDASERTVGIPAGVLIVEFTDGFLDELDRFSSMVWPYNVKKFNKNIKGEFIGVGIHITKARGEPLRVVAPLVGSPAYDAKIKKDDLIIAVDGTPTKDLPIDKLVDMITGKRGTTVVLTIKRQGRLNPFDVGIVRDVIKIPTIKGWHRRPSTGKWSFRLDADKSIGYIRVEQFTDASAHDLVKVLDRLRKADVNALVLDLRFNGGGKLGVTIRVVDEFVRSGRIVSTKGRQRSTAWSADDNGRYLDGDLVVLINDQSASAAEITSGALKDLKRAVVVGQRSYGKGSVQTVIDIPGHRAELKLTTAYYYLPNGRLIHRRNGQKEWGVDPDAPVFITPRQMRRWLEIRRDTDLVQDISEAELAGDLAEQYKADIQLRAAVLILKLKRLRRSEPPA